LQALPQISLKAICGNFFDYFVQTLIPFCHPSHGGDVGTHGHGFFINPAGSDKQVFLQVID
jgi:hypothetical protein